MSTKGFMALIAVALLFGGSIGGAFFGGLAMGKSDDADGTETVAAAAPQSQATDQLSFAQLQEQLRSGELTQEDLARLREQFGGQTGQDGAGGFRRGFGGGGTTGGFAGAGLTGAIESMQDGTLTVNTAQGPLQASIGPDTVIRTLAEITPDDLTEGMQVTVTGERGEDGVIRAVSITLLPEGEGFPGGFGGLRGGGGRLGAP
jgi:hypothetical protein